MTETADHDRETGDRDGVKRPLRFRPASCRCAWERRSAGMATHERDDGEALCECELEPVPGAVWPMNEDDDGAWSIERCDLCARFEDDRAAADAVAHAAQEKVKVRTREHRETYFLAGLDAGAAHHLRDQLLIGRT